MILNTSCQVLYCKINVNRPTHKLIKYNNFNKLNTFKAKQIMKYNLPALFSSAPISVIWQNFTYLTKTIINSCVPKQKRMIIGNKSYDKFAQNLYIVTLN